MKVSVKKPPKWLAQYATAVIFGALVSIAALFLLSAVMFLLQLPSSVAPVLALAAMGLGAFISALLLGKKRRRGGLSLGLKGGGILWLFCIIGALISGGADGSQWVAKLLVALITGMAGGVMGVNSREKL